MNATATGCRTLSLRKADSGDEDAYIELVTVDIEETYFGGPALRASIGFSRCDRQRRSGGTEMSTTRPHLFFLTHRLPSCTVLTA